MLMKPLPLIGMKRTFCAVATATPVPPPSTSDCSSAAQLTSFASPRLRDMLANSEKFVNNKGFSGHNVDRAKQVPSRSIIVTCMDTRLTTLLPAAIGIQTGDAKVIKTAGAIITHPFGSTMRSIVVALYMLNADEVSINRQNPSSQNKKKIDPYRSIVSSFYYINIRTGIIYFFIIFLSHNKYITLK